jgi:hypothetical protein
MYPPFGGGMRNLFLQLTKFKIVAVPQLEINLMILPDVTFCSLFRRDREQACIFYIYAE